MKPVTAHETAGSLPAAGIAQARPVSFRASGMPPAALPLWLVGEMEEALAA